MDELHSRLLGEHEQLSSSASGMSPQALAHVRRGASRRRRVRAMTAGTASALAIGAIGAGAWGLTGIERAHDVQPMVSDTATPVPHESASTPAPSPSPDNADGVTTGPPIDDSADGIPEDGYPQLTTDRNSAKTAAAGITYPAAHQLEDWVWDRVGPGWALETATVALNRHEEGWEQPPAVVYLVSPEQRYFEVSELPERAWNQGRVVSWREGLDTAMIWWVVDQGDSGRTGAAGALNLRTGDVSDLTMAVQGKAAHDYRFVAANAAGDELWRAESDNGYEFYRWHEAASEDGWVASALVEQVPTADNPVLEVSPNDFSVTGNGDRVLLSADGPGWDAPPRTEVPLLTYDLSSDSIRHHALALPVEVGTLRAFDFVGADAVAGYFDAHPDSAAATSSHELLTSRVQVTLAGSSTTISSGAIEPNERPAVGAPVPFYGATPRGAGAQDCGC